MVLYAVLGSLTGLQAQAYPRLLPLSRIKEPQMWKSRNTFSTVAPVEIDFHCSTAFGTGEPSLKGQRISLFSLTTCKNEHNQIKAISGQKVTMQPYNREILISLHQAQHAWVLL